MTTNNDDTPETANYGDSATIKTAQTNSDDINYYLLEMDDMVIALENKDAVIKELKELLKECKVAFKIYANEDETCGLEEENKYAKHLLTKIDNVIGEKK